MSKRKNLILASLFLAVLFCFTISASTYTISNSQSSYSSSNSFRYMASQGIDLSPLSSKSFDCSKGNDFILQIAPEGCSPTVVRSDLLEEQNVPVFCPIVATKINPAIEVDSIESMSFRGNYPKEISGVGFHPANAALKTSESRLINSPILSNAGYVVIVLKKTPNETAMPDYVTGNLTATIKYDSEKAFGIGQTEFYLNEMSDFDWKENYQNFGFWSGKGFLRVDSVTDDQATISLYQDAENRLSSFTLKKGERSTKVYLPGFYCTVGVEVQLVDLTNPDTRVKLRVGDDVLELKKGDAFLENRCRVRSITKQGLVEQTQLYCSRDDKKQSTFTLSISPTVRISGGEKKENFVLGDRIKASDKNYYLAYIDSKGASDKSENLVLWVVSAPLDLNKNKLTEAELSSYASQIKKYDLNKLYLSEKSSPIAGTQLEFLIYNSASSRLGLTNLGFFTLTEKTVNNENLAKAISTYQNLSDTYSSVSKRDSSGLELTGESYSEQGLIEAIDLSEKFGDYQNQEVLMNKLVRLYPSEKNKALVAGKSNSYLSSNTQSSTEIVSVNSVYRSISLEGIYEPLISRYGITMTVKRADGTVSDYQQSLSKDFVYRFDSKKGGGTVTLTDLDYDSATLTVNIEGDKKNSGKVIKLTTKGLVTVGAYTFKLDDINLVKEAKVNLNPIIDDQYSESNVSFKIGIEKRAVQLSPQEIKDKLKALNETIEEWQDISDDLGDVVKGLKGACLATGAVLTVKNFFDGLSGGATARQYAMRGIDGKSGIYQYCTEQVSQGHFSNTQKCLADSEIKARIESSTATYQKILQEQQTTLSDVRSKSLLAGSSTTLEAVVNDSAYLENYASQVGSKIDPNLINPTTASKGFYSITDLRTLEACKKLETENKALWEKDCKLQVEKITKQITDAKSNDEATTIINEKLKTVRAGFASDDVILDKRQVSLPYRQKTITKSEVSATPEILNSLFTEKIPNRNVAFITYYSTSYVVFLSDKSTSGSTYTVDKAYQYTVESSKVVLGTDDSKLIKDKIGSFVLADTYEMDIKECVVRYFGSDPDKGHPAVVPFNFKKGKGWYAGVRHATTSLGGSTNYAQSGAPTSYYVCNAGSDGEVNFNPDAGTFTGGDECISFDPVGGTIATVNAFGYTSSDSAELARRAASAINEAGLYSTSKKTVTITGRTCKVGDAAADLYQTQCYDFMSPSDCELLFNVCDPVVCPSSRCNLGGNYPVSDVIQSGIIGSLVLCLPNFKLFGGDVYIPVCLSGLKAGIDGLLSVMKSYRECLQEKLDSGETIGVCDEVYSIYLCQFFWSQVSPLTDLAIPRILQFIQGESVRGGGEYMNVQSSWDNAQKSVQYFTNQYASGSFKALDNGAINAAVTEVCKNFPSAGIPEGNLLDSLTNPVSPSQYSGWFSEIPFTSATIPPISQYSVFYQIYAGNDQGVYFRVYLKNPKGTTVAYDNPTITVDSGYITKGQQASQKKDFTSASGYQEMCIVVNDQEKCGFKQVSTDFAINYIKDTTVANQASATNITKEKDCISGTANAYALLNPNIQSGVTSVVNPNIKSQGIVRVCSTNNPGANVGSGRWSVVGYCDDPTLKCWIDEQSIKEAINMKNIENETLSAVNTYNQDVLLDEKAWFLSGEISQKIKIVSAALDLADTDSSKPSKLHEAINSIDTLLKGNDPSGKKVFYDYQKAYLTLLKGQCYGKLAELEKSESDSKTAVVSDSLVEKINCNDLSEEECAKNSKECYWDTADMVGFCLDISLKSSTSEQTKSSEEKPALLTLYSKDLNPLTGNTVELTQLPIFIKKDSSWSNIQVFISKDSEDNFEPVPKFVFNSNTFGAVLRSGDELPTLYFVVKVEYLDSFGESKKVLSDVYEYNKIVR